MAQSSWGKQEIQILRLKSRPPRLPCLLRRFHKAGGSGKERQCGGVTYNQGGRKPWYEEVRKYIQGYGSTENCFRNYDSFSF